MPWALPWSRVRGFAAAGETAVNYHMSEFFIRKQHRRVGIGRDAAKLIFDRFAGDWEIVEYLRNPGAVAFWRRVVSAYCAGRYHRAIPQRRSAPAFHQPSGGVGDLGA